MNIKNVWQWAKNILPSRKEQSEDRSKSGVAAVEYALVLAGVAVAVIALFGTTGAGRTGLNDAVTAAFDKVGSAITPPPASSAN